MPSLVGDTTRVKGYTDKGGYGNTVKSYYQKMLEQQRAAQQAAQQAAQAQTDANYARYKTYAEEQQKQAKLAYDQDVQKKQSFWYQLTQQSAKETNKQWGPAIRNWVDQHYDQVQYADRGMWGNTEGFNQIAGVPYQNYGNLPLEAQYQYGLPTPRSYFEQMIDEYKKSITPQKKSPPTPYDLEVLREQRRGYRVGLPGIDGVTPPQVMGSNLSPGSGYGGGYSLPDFMYPNYGGWAFPKSESASRWYNSMVQWNIGNK